LWQTEREAVEYETRMVHKHALFANNVYGDEFERQSKELESQPKVAILIQTVFLFFIKKIKSKK
jgi:hypothetical protein